MRTARGAGRFFAEGRFADEPRLVLLVRVVEGFLPVLRDRVLEPLRPVVRDPDVDVLLLRDPGGEDVRVAMLDNVIDDPTSHRDHTERVAVGHVRRRRRSRRAPDGGDPSSPQRVNVAEAMTYYSQAP